MGMRVEWGGGKSERGGGGRGRKERGEEGETWELEKELKWEEEKGGKGEILGGVERMSEVWVKENGEREEEGTVGGKKGVKEGNEK